MKAETGAAAIVNLDAYPLHETDGSSVQRTLRHAREMLDHDGACVLPDFLSAAGLEQMAAEAAGLTDLAWPSPERVTPYYGKLADRFPEGHPRQTRLRADMSLVADFNVPPRSAVKRLYEWQPLRTFLARLLGVPRLHSFVDPCQTVNVSVMREGGEQPWHFDSGRFTVTLLLQQALSGGEFEYVPGLRSADDENYAGVAAVLGGERSAVRIAKLTPGTLFVFLGEHSLHRVTPVGGSATRLIAIYLYDSKPGRWATRSSNVRLYGPDAEVAMDAAGMQESPSS